MNERSCDWDGKKRSSSNTNKELSEQFIYASMSKLEFERRILFASVLFRTATESTLCTRNELFESLINTVSCPGSFDRDCPTSGVVQDANFYFPFCTITQLIHGNLRERLPDPRNPT